MKLIEIDERKCKRDGICVSECPSGIIRLKDKASLPEVVPGGENFCVRCGHCVAVCPHGALSHVASPFEKSPPIVKEHSIGLDQAVQFLRSRRSIRQFREEAVEKEKIQRLIEIARYAPTGGNTQLVQWWVFTDRSELRRFSEIVIDFLRHLARNIPASNLPSYFPGILAGWDAGRDSILRNTPVMIVAAAPAEYANGLVDLTIALSYLQLAAPMFGLGTCWAGLVQRALLQWEPMKEAVGLPAQMAQHYPMMLGYPKLQYHRVPERKQPEITWR